jgi:BMFP domain-containing protein YqiC
MFLLCSIHGQAPTDAVLPILAKIQESIAALRTEFRSELGQFRQSTETRLDRLEALVRKQRRDAAGMLVMMRAAASDFDERVSEVEERVAALEGKTT